MPDAGQSARSSVRGCLLVSSGFCCMWADCVEVLLSRRAKMVKWKVFLRCFVFTCLTCEVNLVQKSGADLSIVLDYFRCVILTSRLCLTGLRCSSYLINYRNLRISKKKISQKLQKTYNLPKFESIAKRRFHRERSHRTSPKVQETSLCTAPLTMY